ncbi:hypothetical protein Bhyg_05790 [Pseudolycoriella hygida]|uniref:Uncharacterized protein n=1 Tax=Pseudolycoriella hygida TaxID=35572 RepID=A0A9Q0S0C3_9DIPT|nr:hypothetical protein Bhyg_05790 [Pseudolycoriella hygida]
MYHAVMEEVVRFLDRCHQSLNAMQTNQIGRSKSINHVFGNDLDGKARTRTSTNVMDRSNEISDVEASNASLSGSYSNFRDFTWRRPPKQVQPSTDHNIELNPDKLSQEAFRLLRTAQNLISLKEPSLSDIQSDTQSTDDSVHSTSSSRHETDEETHNHQSPPAFCMMPSSHMNRKEFIKSMTQSAADDESGFSSMNSFQEIGIPTPILSGSEKSADSAPETIPEDESDANDITIVQSNYASKAKHAVPVLHRRWESAPPIPPKRNLSTYNGDDAPKVLWV